MKPTHTPADAARFWAKVNVRGPRDCWLYTGALTGGYGRFWWNGRTGMAHRFAWETTHGPLAPDEHLDHLCRNRACCNPAHLEPVTLAENVLRGAGITATNARKTHCKNGHPFTPENTYQRPGKATRNCITCQRTAVRRWRERKDNAA